MHPLRIVFAILRYFCITFQEKSKDSATYSSTFMIGLHEITFLNFGMVFFTAMKKMKLRKAHCSPPLVGEDNSMVFTSHSVPFPATRDLRSLVAGNGTS